MSRLEEFKESKQYILEDTLGSITPANSREADIYSFMRSYLDDELGGEDKAELLEELALNNALRDLIEAKIPFSVSHRHLALEAHNDALHRVRLTYEQISLHNNILTFKLNFWHLF